ncbi:MAG: hypothetical protein WA151_11930 [Desulfatirhabdiaceae bacterium]
MILKIFIGLFIVLVAYGLAWQFFGYCETLKCQFDRDRKLSARPQPWKYQ